MTVTSDANDIYLLTNRDRVFSSYDLCKIVANGVDAALIVGVGGSVCPALIVIRDNAVNDRCLVLRRLFALSVGRGRNLGLGRLLVLRLDGYLGLGLRRPPQR